MHPQDTVIERARMIANELTSYDKATKTEAELHRLVEGNSLLAEVLDIQPRQLEKAMDRLQFIRVDAERSIKTIFSGGFEE